MKESLRQQFERLMLRQFVEEEDVRIDLLIDQSHSMRFGAPMTKFEFAVRAVARDRSLEAAAGS